MSDRVAERLRQVEVLDTEGRPVRLGALWEEQPVVLVFVRHYGWMFCREQVAQLRDAVDEIRRRGAELVVVGNGRPHQAAAFARERGLDFELLTDPDLVAYRAAGLRRDLGSTLSLGMLKSAVRALGTGKRQGRTAGDPWQQGGAFVIVPPGRVLFSYVSREAGDHPDPRDLVASLPG